MNDMRHDPEQLIRLYGLTPHVEGGAFRELYRETPGGERQSSGIIYYALRKGEHADFHVLDCDEYWLHHSGGPVELWMFREDGTLEKAVLGVGEGASPAILIPAGVVFGARLLTEEGCFMSCVTVPEFTYEHYRILPRAEMVGRFPQSEGFFKG